MYAVFNPRKSYKENTLTFHFQKKTIPTLNPASNMNIYLLPGDKTALSQKTCPVEKRYIFSLKNNLSRFIEENLRY